MFREAAKLFKQFIMLLNHVSTFLFLLLQFDVHFTLKKHKKGAIASVYSLKQVKSVGGAGRRDSIIKMASEESSVQADSV